MMNMLQSSVDRGSTTAAGPGEQDVPRGGPVLDDTVDASTVTRQLGDRPVTCSMVVADQDAGRDWRKRRLARPTLEGTTA
jgi:hypothetical protein